MAKGKNDKNDKAGKAATSKAAKAAKDGKPTGPAKDGAATKDVKAGTAKDAKKAPRPAVAPDRSTGRTGGALPGPPPPAGDPGPGRGDVPAASEPLVPAARTAPDGATADVRGAPVAPEVAPPVTRAATGAGDRPANGAGPGPDARPVRRPAAPAAARATSTAPAGAVAPAASAVAVTPPGPDRRPGLVDELTTLAMVPVDVARRVLPERRLPFYLGVGALAVVGVVEWPVVLAAGMAWEALRRRRS